MSVNLADLRRGLVYCEHCPETTSSHHKVNRSTANIVLITHIVLRQATPSPSPTAPRPPSDLHCLWRMLLQHLLEVTTCMAGGMLCHRFRGTHHQYLTAREGEGADINVAKQYSCRVLLKTPLMFWNHQAMSVDWS